MSGHSSILKRGVRPWFAALGFAAGLAGAAPALAADEVTVGLAIPLTVDNGGVYALGNELGFFAKENISVKTVVFQGAGVLLPQVASHQVTIGLPLPEPVLSSYETGKAPLPVEYFYNATPANEIELAVLADSNIHTIADLKGKKIGVGALTWGTIPSTRALLRDQGLTPGKDVEIIPVGILGSGFLALRQGRVDALNYNSIWHAMLEQTGTKIRRLPYPDTFRRMISNGFVSASDTVEKNPDLLVRFGRAYTESLVACDANPRLCVEAFWRLQPESRPKDGDAAKNLDSAVALVKLRMAKTLRTADGKPRVAGEFNLENIRKFVQAMHQAGEFNTDQIPVDRIFTNKLVPEFSRFDAEAVRAKALAAH